jgi:hypothetical protein
VAARVLEIVGVYDSEFFHKPERLAMMEAGT